VSVQVVLVEVNILRLCWYIDPLFHYSKCQHGMVLYISLNILEGRNFTSFASPTTFISCSLGRFIFFVLEN
jgi:hypothetical protein